ncbi:MAG: hypothetical protein AAFY72_13310 [Cyanobacteria bacterium J06649_4]
MTPQQLDSRSQQLEARVATLEEELAQLRQLFFKLKEGKKHGWQAIIGSFENDPTFDEATRLGKEWRKSSES